MDAPIEVIRNVLAATVNLHVRIRRDHPSVVILGNERMGSGVIVDRKGSVLTVNYVVLGAKVVTVTLSDGRQVPGEVVAKDFESGLAVVKVQGGRSLPALPLGSSSAVKLGHSVFIMGTIGPLERRVSGGFVSYLGEFDAPWEYALDRAIMTTAPNPGFGGAPLCDLSQRVIGIISLNIGELIRPSLAIPIDLYMLRQEELLRFGTVVSRSKRAWVGFYVEPTEQGIEVAGLVPGGPAEAAGLLVGDVIRGIGYVGVETRRELYGELWKKRPGEKVEFRILRGGALRNVEVISGEREAFYR
ncbi:MAG: serine protease [candidate division NC10 bacterium]|nr:serine protease [candidate division NC10 bacterium]